MRKHETAVCGTACTVVWEVDKCENRRQMPFMISIYLLPDFLHFKPLHSLFSLSFFLSFFLSSFLLPFFFLSNLSNLSPSFFPFFVPPFYLLNNLSFFFVSPFQTFHNHYSFSPFHHLSLFFLYSFKSLCFNGLCPFVKMRVKALRSKRTLNK